MKIIPEPSFCAVCHHPITAIPGEHPSITARRKYHPGECNRRGYNMVRNNRIYPVPASIQKLDLTDYLKVKELAASCGVTSWAIYAWLRRQNRKRWPYFIIKRHVTYVRADVAHEYAAKRAPAKPKGWVTFKSVLSELPEGFTSGYNLLRALEAEGKVTTETYRGCLYLPPEDAALLLRSFSSSFALPGWTPVTETARRAGVTAHGLTEWAKRNKVELRFYRHPKNFHLVHYLETKHAEAYIARSEPRRGPRVERLEAAHV